MIRHDLLSIHKNLFKCKKNFYSRLLIYHIYSDIDAVNRIQKLKQMQLQDIEELNVTFLMTFFE